MTVPFFLFWGGGAAFFAYQAWSSHYIPFFMKLVTLLFVIAGIFLNMNKFIDKWNRENTYYGLTSRNVIIVTDFVGRMVNKFDLTDLGEVKLHLLDEGRGTITFGIQRFRFMRIGINSLNYRVRVNPPFLGSWGAAHLSFDTIENPRVVYGLLEESFRSRTAAGSNTSFPDANVPVPGQPRLKYGGVIIFLIWAAFLWYHSGRDFVKKILSPERASVTQRKHRVQLNSAEWVEWAYADKREEYAHRSAAELHAEGLRLYDQGKHHEAIIPWLYEAEKDRNANTLNNLSLAYSKVNLYQKAGECSRQALQLDPDFVKAYKSLGAAQLGAGDDAGARESYLKALELGAGDDFVYVNLGLAERNLGHESEAMEYLRKAKTITPAYPEIDAYLDGKRWSSTKSSR